MLCLENSFSSLSSAHACDLLSCSTKELEEICNRRSWHVINDSISFEHFKQSAPSESSEVSHLTSLRKDVLLAGELERII